MSEFYFERFKISNRTAQKDKFEKLMSYHSKPLKNGRWGIYINDELIATIGCPDACQKIISCLENRLSNERLPISVESYGVSQYFHSLKLQP